MHQQLQTQLIQTIKEDLSNPILRYYLQEEAFLCDPKTPHSLFQLPFNQIAAEVVAQVTLSNKQITNNSRVAANLLENGKEIFRNKKLQYFNSFKSEYKLIGEALQSLGIQQRSVFQYSVMAISNLILKLSLNMSRISIIMIAKLFTVPVLNPFITAILFQKFLQKQHLRSKEAGRKQQDHLHLLKQFPKISIVKISQKSNPFDRYYIKNSQRLFGPQAHNVQFIQLYETEGQYAHLFENLDKRDSYHMKELLGLTFPFGMEFYLFFSEIIVPKIQSYKPDIVIYYEDLPCESEVGINPQIKGLIINLISQKIQNKIYVFKQFGLTPNSPLLINPLQIEQQGQSIEAHNQKAPNIWSAHDQDSDSNIQKQNLGEFNPKELIKIDSIEMNKINQQVTKTRRLEITAKKMAALSNFKTQKTEMKTLDLEAGIKKMRRILFDDLTYISLALLQKENFQNLNNTFRNYVFPTLFLGKFKNWIIGQVQEVSKTKNFSDEIVALQKKIYMLEGMFQISELSSVKATNVQTNYPTFYNLQTKRVQTISEWVNNEAKAINVGKNDQSYYHYTKTYVLLFVFSTSAKIFAKRLQDTHFVCLREDKYESYQSQKLAAKHSTLVSNNKYFYKAFGQYEDPTIKQSYICYLDIESIEKIQDKQAIQWEFIKECQYGTGKVKLEKKKYGWGTSIDLKNGNLVILGGGYNYQAENEEKVNKFLYIISKVKEVEKIGKINPQKTMLQENLKYKNIIIPCVYGIPLAYSNGELIVLNTNGYNQKLNYLKKIFVTRIKVAGKKQIYILGQSKMDYNAKKTEEAIANKNTILSLMIGSYNQINRYESVTSLSDSQGNIQLLKIDEGKSKDNVRLYSDTKETTKMCEEDADYQITFQRSRLVLKQDENKLFMRKVLG